MKMANSLRGEVLNLYKNLLYLGRDYPKGADYFKRRLKNAFLKNKDVKDPEKIKELIRRGEFVMKELEALYFLRKYRAMKQRYYSDINKTNWSLLLYFDWKSVPAVHICQIIIKIILTWMARYTCHIKKYLSSFTELNILKILSATLYAQFLY